MGTLTAFPVKVRDDATSLLVYKGAPHVSIAWSLTGAGTLEAFSTVTDETGVAAAKYTPGTAGQTVTVGVTVGT